MPSEEALTHKKAYDAEYYRKNIIKRTIAFNKTNPEDMKMYEFLHNKKNSAQFVKDLIRSAMEAGK